MKQSLLERIRNSNDPNLGAALVRMAHEAVAVHQYEATVGGDVEEHGTRSISASSVSGASASRLISRGDDLEGGFGVGVTR